MEKGSDVGYISSARLLLLYLLSVSPQHAAQGALSDGWMNQCQGNMKETLPAICVIKIHCSLLSSGYAPFMMVLLPSLHPFPTVTYNHYPDHYL